MDKISMKMNKKILLFLISILLISAAAVLPLFSAGEVASADAKTYLYVAPSKSLSEISYAAPSKVIFYFGDVTKNELYLPETYYLVYISEDDSKYNVSYAGIEGYVGKADFTAPKSNGEVDRAGEAPNVILTLSVNSFSNALNIYDNTYSYYYLGDNAKIPGEIFVKAVKNEQTSILSVPKEKFASFTVPLHNVALNAKADLERQTGGGDGATVGETTDSNDKLLRGILIAGIAVPALLIIILLFIPRKKKNDYDSFVRKKYGEGYRYPAAPPYERPYDRYERYDDRRYDRDYYDRGYDRDRRDW